MKGEKNLEYARIEEVNKRLKPIDIKGKDYNTVNQRILAFRELYPDGSIVTEILHQDAGVILMKATAFDENGKIIATGHAQEKEESSYLNKTSYVENCETSAVGRCLGNIGIGAVDSIASKEEVDNQINAEQKRKDDVEQGMKDELLELYNKAGGKNFEKWISDCGGFSAENFPKMKSKLLKQINDKAEEKKK